MKGAIGLVFYSHVIPFILGLIGILLMCTGVMDDKPMYTSLGLIIFFVGGLLPFIILPIILGL
nr:hypothetical protein [Methanothermus fervidus]